MTHERFSHFTQIYDSSFVKGTAVRVRWHTVSPVEKQNDALSDQNCGLTMHDWENTCCVLVSFKKCLFMYINFIESPIEDPKRKFPDAWIHNHRWIHEFRATLEINKNLLANSFQQCFENRNPMDNTQQTDMKPVLWTLYLTIKTDDTTIQTKLTVRKCKTNIRKRLEYCYQY